MPHSMKRHIKNLSLPGESWDPFIRCSYGRTVGLGLRRRAVLFSLHAQQIDLEMHLPRGEDGAAGAAGALVEADHPGGGELVERAQHVLLGAAGGRGSCGNATPSGNLLQ